MKQFLLGLSVLLLFSIANAQQVIPLNTCPDGGYVGPGQSCDGPTYRYLTPTWGAFAVGMGETGAGGKATSTKNQEEANAEALQICGQKGKNCQIAMTFKNTCAAMAWGSSGVGRGTSGETNNRDIAERRALAQCKQSGDSTCKIQIKGFCAGAKNW